MPLQSASTSRKNFFTATSIMLPITGKVAPPADHPFLGSAHLLRRQRLPCHRQRACATICSAASQSPFSRTR